MKTTGASLVAHMEQETTTLATCWKVTRADGRVFGFTDHDQDLTGITGHTGVTFEASTGYSRTAIRSAADLSVDNLELEGMFSSDSITESELKAGRWDYATVEIFQVNWADVSMGTHKLRKGVFGQCTAARNRFQAELRGLTQFLQQEIGDLYAPFDRADLDDHAPGGIGAWTFSGTVSTVTDARNFTTNLAQADGYFNGGKLTFVGSPSLNSSLSMEVKTYLLASGAVVLQLPMPYTVSPGDTFTVTAGYDKAIGTALTKFANVVNFRGEPYVPGNDQILSGGL